MMIGSLARQFIKPHRQDSKILISFLLFAVVAFGLILLGSEVAEGDTFALDKMIITSLRTANNPGLPITPYWVTSTAIDCTALGSRAVLTLITLLALGYLLAVRRVSTACFVALAVAGGAALSVAIKSFFLRPRPEIVPHLVSVSTPSFPSGHAMNSAIVYLTLTVLLARSERNRSVQVYLVGSAVAVTLLVGSTRVFLGVHWPSDVLAGWAVGAIWAASCSLLAKRLRARRAIE
ncbi:MAG: phosphatase PAP2 family protein [Sphingobium sp.]